MLVNATVFLETLSCIRERDEHGHSEPYNLASASWRSTPAAKSVRTAPAVENARVVIKNDMGPGDIANIPSSVGEVGNASGRRSLR